MLLGCLLPRECVLVKAGTCFQLMSRVGRNPHRYPMTLHSPWMSTRDRSSHPLKGLMECTAVLRGSFSLAWGSAGLALSSLRVLPSVLRDAVHLVVWSCLVDIFSLSSGPGQSLQLAMGGKFGGERKGLLGGEWAQVEGKGALGFSLRRGLDRLPMDPSWVWVWGDVLSTLARAAAPCRDKSLVAGARETRFTFVLPHG